MCRGIPEVKRDKNDSLVSVSEIERVKGGERKIEVALFSLGKNREIECKTERESRVTPK